MPSANAVDSVCYRSQNVLRLGVKRDGPQHEGFESPQRCAQNVCGVSQEYGNKAKQSKARAAHSCGQTQENLRRGKSNFYTCNSFRGLQTMLNAKLPAQP